MSQDSGVTVDAGYAGAALIVVVGAAASKLLGFFREATLAAYFGTSWETDAFLVALVIPIMLFGLLGDALHRVFIPVYTEFARESPAREDRQRLASLVLNAGLLAIGSLMAVAWVLAPQLIALLAPGFAAEVHQLAVQMTRVMLFAMLFLGLANWSAALLHVQRHFAAPALNGVLYNLVLIPVIVAAGHWWGIQGVAWGVVAAAASQVALNGVPLHLGGLRWRAVFSLAHPAVLRIAEMIAPVMVGKSARRLNTVVDRMLASTLREGSIAALNFGRLVSAIPDALISRTLIIVLYPQLSEEALADDRGRFRNMVRQGMGLILFAGAPLVALMLVFDRQIVEVLFERGVFDAAATAMTAVALAFFALGMLSESAKEFLRSAFHALQDTRTPMLISLVTVAANILLNLLLIGPMGHGGLALATSLATTLGALLLAHYLNRRVGALGWRGLLRSLARAGVALGAMVFISLLMREALFRPVDQFIPSPGLVAVQDPLLYGLLGDGPLANLVSLGVAGAVGLLLYLGLAHLLKVPQLQLGRSYAERLWRQLRAKREQQGVQPR